MAIIDFFDRGWRNNPNGIAYSQDDKNVSYEQAGKTTCQVANALINQGFKAGQKGAVWANNDITAWLCALGLWRANLCFIPVGARNSAQENQYILDAFDCEILFFQHYYADVISQIKDQLPKVNTWVCLDGETDFSTSLTDWLTGQAETPPNVEVDLDDVILLSATGGTTGTPKGVMNTHRSIQTFVAFFLCSTPYSVTEKPVNMAAAPMTHTTGILSLPCSARGGTVVILSKPDPQLMFVALMQHSVTEFFLPPTVIYRLLDIPDLNKKVDFSRLKYLFYGAAPMSLDKLKRAIKVFGPVMMGGYGQTEAPAGIAYLPPDEHVVGDQLASDIRLSSVGRPNPLIRVEIMDDDNVILAQGETGEICVRGDLLMKGYYKDPEKTAETIIDGWLHTGDIGYLDNEGYLHITDRKKDMIITGGFNVYPNEVEQVIWSHPAVQDCAIIGIPDEYWGEAVKAVIELNDGFSLTELEVIALCKKKLGSVKAPKTVDFIEQLPRSPVGKVLKKDLRALYSNKIEN